MEENTNISDELIEIRPDSAEDITEDDSDMKVAEEIPAVPVEKAAEEVLTSDSVAADEESDDFSYEIEAMEHESEDMEIVAEIGDSLIRQADYEISTLSVDEARDVGQDVEADSDHVSDDLTEEQPDSILDRFTTFLKKIPTWGYIVTGAVLLILAVVLWFGLSGAGQKTLIKVGSSYFAGRVDYQPVADVDNINVPDETEEQNEIPDDEFIPTASPVETPDFDDRQDAQISVADTDDPVVDPDEQQVFNVLLVGEENMNSGGFRGRSDLIMIATLDLNHGSVKLSSIMRDSLVSIPNYNDNRINAAYAIGGVSLLYDTLKLNLNIDIDNYMLVNFSSFESIIDAIGGVDITLTQAEASYLNKTNYISDPASRNLTSGLNHMNGAQALGYCRIRYVSTADRQYGDFGRTARQREVLNSIMKSVSDMGYFELVSFAGKCLPYVTTDMDAQTIEEYIVRLLEIGMDRELKTLRVPIEGTYANVYVREMLVTQIDLEKNAEALRDFIYEE